MGEYLEEKMFLLPRIPLSTYRLQFNYRFRFPDAREIINYLHDLGISDIYASPYFRAKGGSLHGYDIVDHGELNPEIVTGDEYNELSDELRKYGMGQILDIVPNHMCIESKENIWWMDILENGPASIYAGYFDIDWEPVKKELKDRILIPILGDQYGNVLERQELRLVFEKGRFSVLYYDKQFPVNPDTYINILKYRLESLEKILSSDNRHYIEFLSIIASIINLPRYTEKDPEKIAVRYRDKEIIKERLMKLADVSHEIRAFIAENVRIFNGVTGDGRSFGLLDELLSRQVFRLSFWRVATEEINYRRFFDINNLGAIKIEVPAVFKETHKLVMKFIEEGRITGLRVDHPDGLYDPSQYFEQLQYSCFLHLRRGFVRRLESELPASPGPDELEAEITGQYHKILSAEPQYKPFYIVGEKILIKGERMPEEWPIFSTTGYVFLNTLNGIFVDTRNIKAFDDIYGRFIRARPNYHVIAYEKKKLIMQVSMSSEVNTLGHYLNGISEKNRHTRDFTLNSLTKALVEVIAFFPVYRTYINTYTVKDRDRQYIELAVTKAKRHNTVISGSIFDFIKDLLLLRFPDVFEDADKKEWLDFVMRFQQITGSIMAKGLEDTVFYVYNRLVSLNEVGGMPERFGISLETFHGQNIERIKFWPHALIASSTHDTKRSEDVRARINVLSEIPQEWKRQLATWSRINRKKKVVVDGRNVPDRNEEYFLYQTLIGIWPVVPMDGAGYETFLERIKSYMIKAVREAKLNTSWINQNAIYEEALVIFINAILNNNPENHFLKHFIPFQKKVSQYGMYNSLSQTLLRIASPGVPDFYQGAELWDFSLVDPDNRMPVDYNLRKQTLQEIKERERTTGLSRLSADLTLNKENGMIKQYIIYKALNFRKAQRALFERGEYITLEVYGKRAGNICAFARRFNGRNIIVAVPRFSTELVANPADPPFGDDVWLDSSIAVPFTESGVKYRNIFTGETVNIEENNGTRLIRLSEMFRNSPVALMESIDEKASE
ncbi:MAG: malto-oligosyltrehalose synthase [Nitrospirota bacterium]|nr:malto-oligosyltrehalose synthase [Nitrospirota bacterium]